VYNIYMTRNHFSKQGGPYFRNDGFSKHTDSHNDHTHASVSTIGKIKSFFKSRFKSRRANKK